MSWFANHIAVCCCALGSIVMLASTWAMAGSPIPPAPPAACAGVGPAACKICGTPLGSASPNKSLGGISVTAQSVAPSSGMRSVATDGQTIILTLSPADLAPAHLLDLQGKTIHFTPDPDGYRVQTIPFTWDASFGTQIFDEPSHLQTLTQFQFPFSGQSWSQLYLNRDGNITFGADQSGFYDPGRDRFLLLRNYAGAMSNTVPIVAPLFHRVGIDDPDSVGHRYARELSDRLVVTWVMSEPYRGVFDFTSSALLNQFQAILYSNGNIDFSYNQLSLQEGIVGLFPVDPADRASWSEPDPIDPNLPDYLDLTNVHLAVRDANTLRATFEVRGQPLSVGNPGNDEMLYRVLLDLDAPYTTVVNFSESDVDFGVIGDAPDYSYFATSPYVDIDSLRLEDHTIGFDVSTAALSGATQFSYFADSPDFDAPPPDNFDHDAGTIVKLPQVIATIDESFDPGIPAYIDMYSVVATLVANHSIRFTFNLRGDLPPVGDSRVADNVYRVFVDLDQPFVSGIDFADADIEWGVFGGADLQYHAYGPGISSAFQIDGPSLSFVVPISALKGATQFAFFTDSVDFTLPSDNFDQGAAVIVNLPAIISPNIDISAATASDPARPVVYEAFYYAEVPSEQSMTPTVLAAVGDKFDFLAYYTDFRLDRQETGSSFSGPIGNLVSGVSPSFSQATDWGSAGHLQGVMLVNWINTPLAAPSGADLSGAYTGYNRELTLLSHELGHRWLSMPSADISGNVIAISDPSPHWLQGLHTPVLVSHQTPTEASFMGGSWWQDNGNGTFTNLAQPFYQAGGYSPMDLYFMGLLPKTSVPPFFLIQNLTFSNYDINNKPVYNGTRQNITISNVTAITGDRLPAYPTSQRRFNIGLVGVVQNGASPSAALRTRLAGIREVFTSFWTHSTNNVGRMTALVQGDYNDDGYIDDVDLAVLTACRTRAAVPQPDATCRNKADFDGDGDVDHDDFGYFQRLFTGD